MDAEGSLDNVQKYKKRIYELDLLRGIALLGVMLDHFFLFVYLGYFDYVFLDYPSKYSIISTLYYYSKLFMRSNLVEYCAWFFRGIFIIDVGICFVFSRNNYKRGLKLLLLSFILTLGTYIYAFLINEYEVLIVNGIIHVLSLAILVCAPLYEYIKNKYFFLISSIITFIPAVYLYVNSSWYSIGIDKFNVRFILGVLMGKNHIGHDSFSFLIILSGVLFGIFIGKHFYEERGKKSLLKIEYKNNILTYIGRNSLWYFLFSRLGYPLCMFIILFLLGFKLR